jgi:hypothetical protein
LYRFVDPAGKVIRDNVFVFSPFPPDPRRKKLAA